MVKIPMPGTPGCPLALGGLLLGFLGLVFAAGSIHGLVASDGEPLTNFFYLLLGGFLLLITALMLKSALTPDSFPTSYSDRTSTLSLESVAPSKLEEATDVARVVADIDTKGSGLNIADQEMLDRLLVEIGSAPTEEQVVNVLAETRDGRIAVANPKLQPIAFALRPTALSNYIRGLAIEALATVACIICLPLLLGVEVRAKYGLLYRALRWRRLGKRYRTTPVKRLRSDHRAPILYLRSFSEDYEDDFESLLPKTDEERIVDHYARYGPVIAIGQSKERLPLLGASRIYFDESIWKIAVLYLISISQVVVIQAGFAPGLLWELGVARKRIGPQKLIISFAAWDHLDERRFSPTYLRFKSYAEPLLGCRLPTSISKKDDILFEDGWIPMARPAP